MATMIKEKKPKKKKSKSKNCDLTTNELGESSSYAFEELEEPLIDFNAGISSESVECKQDIQTLKFDGETSSKNGPKILTVKNPLLSVTDKIVDSEKISELAYKDLYTELENMTVIEHEKVAKFEPEKSSHTELKKLHSENADNIQAPSAPMFCDAVEESTETFTLLAEESVKKLKIKVPCLPIEEVIRIFGGNEMFMVKEMSDREEASAEFGGHLQPQHPLVDLIAHFRSSLAAVERERQRISYSYKEEQKARAGLWKIEKRKRNISEKCSCGANVSILVTFDYAELQKNKLAAAKLRLESLLRDVLDSYCSHQHEAMLAYCEIEDLIGLILQRSKLEIRDSLAFILQELKCSDEFGDVYVKILQEWAFTLASALFVTEPDIRDLLYLLHLLFRQSRSVQWAERVVRLPVDDFSSAARLIAFLDILLSQPVPESALECTEDSQESTAEAWEELDVFGTGGAVGKGRLREKDLLAILRALPLRQLIASLVLLSNEEMEGGREGAWSGAAGGGVLKASCGVRVLLHVVVRALPLYRAYHNAHTLLRQLALAALKALAALHMHSSSWYQEDIKYRVYAELEACFVLGFTHLAEDRHELPTTLLDNDALAQYCFTFMSLLHVNTARRIEPLGVDAPVMSCAERVRIVAYAAAEHRNSALANTVLEFLLQTGIKRNSANCEPCRDKCEFAARGLIAHVLSAHPCLHTAAFHMLADINKVESIDPSSVAALSPARWRPCASEVQGVLNDWALKCPALIERLLLQIDCAPHTGMSLESQLVVGVWLCTHTQGRGEVEWAWVVLRRLRLHRSLWGLPPNAPAPTATDTLIEQAFALLACDWGHLIPMVCSTGVSALRRLAAARAADAVHVLDCVMRVLALSPESVALTPEFTEVFTTILNTGPSLMQRALGRGGPSGQHMLRQLLLDQLHEYRSCAVRRSSLLSAWLHALWRPALPPASRGVLDAALRATRDWRTLDAHVMYVLEENGSQMLNDAVTHANVAPLLAHGALRGALAIEQRAGLAPRLLPVLAQQKRSGEKIHVDNALKFIGSNLCSEELVIHRAAASALLAPLEDPAHLTLWSLFFYVYLQRQPDTPSGASPPSGPFFFSGIIKTRTLSQLKKRLQETIIYHRNAAKNIKSPIDDVTKQATADSTPIEPEDCMFPPLTLKDLRGDENLASEPSVDRDEDIRSESEKETDDTAYLISYHTAAEKLVLMYEHWLDEGEEVRALQHHADVARFLTEQDLDAAWKASLGRDQIVATPPVTPQNECTLALTHYRQIVQAIDMLKIESNTRACVLRGVSSVPSINYNDQRAVTTQVEKHLRAIEKLAQAWSAEVRRARTLDEQLWAVVGRLRVRTPLPRVEQRCPKGCRPVYIRIADYEWRQSSSAAREVEENRRSAATQMRRLAQPNTHAVQVTAALIAISRRIVDKAVALRVLETIHCRADDEKAPAHRSLISFITFLAERWVCSDGEASARLLQRWTGVGALALCGAVVHPTRPHARHWRSLYCALLRARLPPPDAFSYLSRFDMAYWTTVVGVEERREVLEALLEAARRFGEKSDEEYQMLIELVGVHSAKICLATDTLRHVICSVRTASASRYNSLPAAYLAHLAPLVTNHLSLLDFTQLAQSFAELGDIWNDASTIDQRYVAYAPHVASLLRALLRAYVVVAVNDQFYTPESVAGRVWLAARGAWSPWVTPPSRLLPPEPPEPRDVYTSMLDQFVDTLVQVMDDCPGCDSYLLRHVWEWTVETYLSSQDQPQQTQLRATALLAHMRRLPWRRQWHVSASLPTAHRVSWLNVPELNAWCSHTWEVITADSWLRGAEGQLLRLLPVLFEIFTSKYLLLSAETLEEACRLPWCALPADATHALLEAYYSHYHNPAQPYHDLPHFKLVLVVSELGDTCSPDELSQLKRCEAVSVWVNRAAAPALAPHVSGHARCLLSVLRRISPLLERCENHLEQVICRAIAMLFMDPAAKEALPLWQQWACACSPRARRALAVAVSTLGAGDAFAPLVDTLAQQILAGAESGGWSTLWRPLVPGQQSVSAAVRRQHYHAAYALLRTAPQSSANTRDIVAALASSSLIFTENEVIISLWICAMCRLACEADSRRASVVEATLGAESSKGREVTCAVRALLAKWAELKRSLLQVVTLQHASVPTQRHRLLCYLGLCIMSPTQLVSGQSPCKDYEAVCHAVSSLGVNLSDILKWGQAPKLSYLPRLVIMLFPEHKIYFEEELDLVSEL